MKYLEYLLLSVLLSVTSFSRQLPAPEVILHVRGEVATPLNLTLADLTKLSHRIVMGVDHDKKEYAFEGVEVWRVLQASGIRFADTLKGKAFSSLVLVVRAADSYQAVFTLAELDPTNSDNAVIVAFNQDGKPLNVKDGALRVICTGDKRHIRWVRQVQTLDVEPVK